MDPKVQKFLEKFGRLPTEVDPDYLEMLRMGKYQVTDVPMYKPGKCANCGSAKNDGRRYVDFGLEVDWYGTVFLCGLCLKDVAQTMGLFAELEAEIEKLKKTSFDIDVLREQGFHLQDTVLKTFEEVKEYHARVHSLGDSSSPDDGSDVVPVETAEAESTADESKSGITKSPTSSGRKNISSLAELLNATD